MAIGNKKIESYVPVVRLNQGLKSSLPISTSSTVTANTLAVTAGVTANTVTATSISVSSTAAITGAFTPTGGVAAAGGFSNPTVWHTGAKAPDASTSGTNVSVATTTTYVAEVFVPVNSTLTGVSVLNGTAVAGNINVGLADSTGLVVAQSATTTAQSGTTAYQQVAFSTTYAAKGPAKYFVLVQSSNTAARFRAHPLGNFGAKQVTSETYGAFLTTASYSTTTFTADVGPIADVY